MKNVNVFVISTVIFPFGTHLLNLLKIDLIPRESVDYFHNIIRKFKEKHRGDESVRK